MDHHFRQRAGLYLEHLSANRHKASHERIPCLNEATEAALFQRNDSHKTIKFVTRRTANSDILNCSPTSSHHDRIMVNQELPAFRQPKQLSSLEEVERVVSEVIGHSGSIDIAVTADVEAGDYSK